MSNRMDDLPDDMMLMTEFSQTLSPQNQNETNLALEFNMSIPDSTFPSSRYNSMSVGSLDDGSQSPDLSNSDPQFLGSQIPLKRKVGRPKGIKKVSIETRRAQNLVAQRNFRARKLQHALELEDRVKQQENLLEEAEAIIDRLRRENDNLRTQRDQAITPSHQNSVSNKPPLYSDGNFYLSESEFRGVVGSNSLIAESPSPKEVMMSSARNDVIMKSPRDEILPLPQSEGMGRVNLGMPGAANGGGINVGIGYGGYLVNGNGPVIDKRSGGVSNTHIGPLNSSSSGIKGVAIGNSMSSPLGLKTWAGGGSGGNSLQISVADGSMMEPKSIQDSNINSANHQRRFSHPPPHQVQKMQSKQQAIAVPNGSGGYTELFTMEPNLYSARAVTQSRNSPPSSSMNNNLHNNVERRQTTPVGSRPPSSSSTFSNPYPDSQQSSMIARYPSHQAQQQQQQQQGLVNRYASQNNAPPNISEFDDPSMFLQRLFASDNQQTGTTNFIGFSGGMGGNPNGMNGMGPGGEFNLDEWVESGSD